MNNSRFLGSGGLDRKTTRVGLAVLGALVAASLACTTIMDLVGAGEESAGAAVAPPAAPATEPFEGPDQEEPTPTQAQESAASEPPQAGVVADGPFELEGIHSTSDGDISGPILRVQITNPSDGEVVAQIPCGLVFEPISNTDEQRLMTIQPVAATIPAGGSADLEPYVICIDGGKAAPSMDSGYQVGTLAAGQLQVFADCICDLDLEAELAQDIMGEMGLQFAIWMTAEGTSPEQFAEQFEFADSPLPDDEFSEYLGEEFADLFGDLEGFFVDPALAWLERCGVEPGL